MAAPDRGFEILEHTADVGLRAWGPSLSAVFEEAAAGLIAIMVTGSAPDTRGEEVSLDAPDGVALLVDWLSEVLFLFDARGFVPHTIDCHVEQWQLRATLRGGDADAFEQQGPAVKAVTYHDAVVRETGSGWEARVYLDV
jgi:SHS2 domain-containing protein